MYDYERRLLDDFARAIDTGGDTLLNACAGRAIVATVNAALESGRTGRAVGGTGPVQWVARDRTTPGTIRAALAHQRVMAMSRHGPEA